MLDQTTAGETATSVASAPEAPTATAPDAGQGSESADSQDPEGGVEAVSSLEAEILAAVEAAVEEMNEGSSDDAGSEEGAAEASAVPEVGPDEADADELADQDKDVTPAAGGDEAKPGAPAPSSSPVALSDKSIERAVLCGYSISEAKQFSSDALLDATCARIEGARGDSGSQSGAGASEDTPASIEKLLSEIPKLDPEEYGEGLASAFESMKGLIQRQQEVISSHSEDRSSDWFDKRLEGVKDFTKGDAGKTASVRKKFDVLQAGYRAAGETVTDEVVFGEAAKLVLGEEMEAARLVKKKTAAKKRSGNLLQRPTGKRSDIEPDVDSETAAEIDRKYFGKDVA